MMNVQYIFILIGILTIVNSFFSFTTWYRIIFLASNLAIFGLTGWCLVLFNKMIFNLQFVWFGLFKIGKFEWFFIFGMSSVSLFFLLLINILVTSCILINLEKTYEIRQFYFLLWILQGMLYIIFTTTDIFLFFLFF